MKLFVIRTTFAIFFALGCSLQARAVMHPGEATEKYFLAKGSLAPKSLAERYEDLYSLASKANIYIPDPITMGTSELCYQIMNATSFASARRNIYQKCFYDHDSARVEKSYGILLDEQLLNLAGGIAYSRYNYEIMGFTKSLYITFFAISLLEKTGANYSLDEIYHKWLHDYPELALKLSKDRLSQIFTDAYLNFAMRTQESRKLRLSNDQLYENLKIEIKEVWRDSPSFYDFKKAKNAGDNLGFKLLKKYDSCFSLLTARPE